MSYVAPRGMKILVADFFLPNVFIIAYHCLVLIFNFANLFPADWGEFSKVFLF